MKLSTAGAVVERERGICPGSRSSELGSGVRDRLRGAECSRAGAVCGGLGIVGDSMILISGRVSGD